MRTKIKIQYFYFFPFLSVAICVFFSCLSNADSAERQIRKPVGKIKSVSNRIEISNETFTEREWIDRFGKGDPDDSKYGKELGRIFSGVYPHDRKSIEDFRLGEEIDFLLYEGDVLKTGDTGEAQIYLNGCMIKMSKDTELNVEHAKKLSTDACSSVIDMIAGTARFFVGKVVGLKNIFKVKTTFAEAGVEGSDFIIELNKEKYLMTLHTSENTKLTLTNPKGTKRKKVAGGTSWNIERDEAPHAVEKTAKEYSEIVTDLRLDFACLWRDYLRVDRYPIVQDYSFFTVPDETPPVSQYSTDTAFQFEDNKTYPEENIMTNPGTDADTPMPPEPPEY